MNLSSEQVAPIGEVQSGLNSKGASLWGASVDFYWQRVRAALGAQEPSQPLTDPDEIQKKYKTWRIRTMYGMFIGYAIFYFCRKNLSAATPQMIATLGLTKTQIGAIWSFFYLSYGVSKFANGILGDRANPRYFMAIGLILSAITNILFGFSTSLIALGVLWTLNGWFQGMGWPPCARLLTHWYSQNERGTTWAIWNTAHQIGGGLILLLAGFLAERMGWEASFYVPALIAIVSAFFIADRLRDTPESLGLPSIEVYRNNVADASDQLDASKKKSLLRSVLANRKIWYLCGANFFVYLVRFGAMDWAPTFLVETKHSGVAAASFQAAGFEFLGIAGALIAAWVSDKLFGGRRAMVNVIYMILLAFVVLEFWWIPPGYPTLDAIALSAVGFLVYGPQMLVGVSAADIAGKQAAATATGFTGLFGYLGSILSGIGTGWIVDQYGWDGGFILFVSAAFLGAFFFILTREERVKAFSSVS